MTEITLQSVGDEMRAAMKAGDKERVAVLRSLMTALRNEEVFKMGELSADDVLTVISREVRKREEAAGEYRKGGREDRASDEEREADILRAWLPEPLSEGDLDKLIDQAVAETGASTSSDMGKVMKALMPHVKGRADGRVVSEKVKQRLS